MGSKGPATGSVLQGTATDTTADSATPPETGFHRLRRLVVEGGFLDGQ